MKYPNLKEEKKLWKRGFKIVVGLDEAGRGCLAGPVVAAAVTIKNPKSEILNPKQILMFQTSNSKRLEHWKIGISNLFRISNLGFRISKLRDSKKLIPKQREKLYKFITKSPFIKWGIGKVSEKIIDKINIKNAAELAMEKALKNLEKKIKKKADFLIIDGNHINSKKLKTRNYKLIVKGDEKILSCAMASIIAKVTRDKIMEKYAKKYPKYGFEKHKGYSTKEHLKNIKKYGILPIHRRSFCLK
jgi:ribonuclease HII